jgi:hypothetical protein
MNQDKDVKALLHIRKLRGGSQPILVRASDACFYIVKFLNNLQGPNLLFNEALGTELFRRVGLPVPEWRPVYVSDEFIDQNPQCWMETEHGQLRPQAGWCFGSRYLGVENAALYEILPGQSFNRVENRKDFWTAWVIDVFCGHADNRQTIFREQKATGLKAYFIDHGHLFGGASGVDSPVFLASRYLDPRIYINSSEQHVNYILRIIKNLDSLALFDIANNLPEGWSTETAISGLKRFVLRISDPVLLSSAVHCILDIEEHTREVYDRRQARDSSEFKCSDMHSKILPSGVGVGITGWDCDTVGCQKQHGTRTVCPSLPYAANF